MLAMCFFVPRLQRCRAAAAPLPRPGNEVTASAGGRAEAEAIVFWIQVRPQGKY